MDARSPTVAPRRHRYPPGPGWGALLIAVLGTLAIFASGARLDMDRVAAVTGTRIAAWATGAAAAEGPGVQVALWPPQIEERTEWPDPSAPAPAWALFARVEVETRAIERLNPETLAVERVEETRAVLVEPVGYVLRVVVKMVETLEMALFATILATVISLPFAILAARGYSPHGLARAVARAMIGVARAVPEFISALFLVLIFGFGPAAGVLALSVHGVGFLGRFLADDIEHADPRPQAALRAIGASRLRVLRAAVAPEIAPQAVASVLYVLDRNVRTAAIIGLVGAGGVGQELRGRFDLYQYGHVATIIIFLVLTVWALDFVSSAARRRLFARNVAAPVWRQ